MTSSHCTVIAKAICSPLICYRELQQVGNVNIGLGWKSCTQLYCATLPSCEFFQHRQHSHPVSRASVFHSTQDYMSGIGTSELTGRGPEIIIPQVWPKLRRWGCVQVVDKNFMGTYKCELLGAWQQLWELRETIESRTSSCIKPKVFFVAWSSSQSCNWYSPLPDSKWVCSMWCNAYGGRGKSLCKIYIVWLKTCM